VEILDRIARGGGVHRVLAYPGGLELDPQRELSSGVIAEVTPSHGEPWIGVFELGSYTGDPRAPRQVLDWPDGSSICVVDGGKALVVRTDVPAEWFEIDCATPIAAVLVVPDRSMVVFADSDRLVACGPRGLLWRSETDLDAFNHLRVEGDRLIVNRGPDDVGLPVIEYAVDLATGARA
jgi:hypothetical protein